MKKFLLIALAFGTLQAMAQEPRRESFKDHGKMMNLSAEEMATLQTKKMTLHLNLDEKQQKEIYAINLENATARKAHMQAQKAKRESGNAEKPSDKERVKMMNAKLDHQIAMKNKMRKILNDEQFSKWEKAQAKKRSKKEGMKKSYQMKKKNE